MKAKDQITKLSDEVIEALCTEDLKKFFEENRQIYNRITPCVYGGKNDKREFIEIDGLYTPAINFEIDELIDTTHYDSFYVPACNTKEEAECAIETLKNFKTLTETEMRGIVSLFYKVIILAKDYEVLKDLSDVSLYVNYFREIVYENGRFIERDRDIPSYGRAILTKLNK